MAFNAKEVPILDISSFIGLDATSSPTMVDAQHATAMSNVVPNRTIGAFCTAQGRAYVAGNTNFSAAVLGLFSFWQNPPNVGTQPVLLAVCSDGKLEWNTIPGANVVKQTGLSTTAIPSFCASQQWAFFTNGVDNPLKIDTFGTVTNWGITAPAAAPTASPTGTAFSGNMTPGGQYAYGVTFGNATLESSVSPLTAFITLANTPSQGTITLSGATPFTAGTAVSIAVGSAVANYTIQTNDTLDTIASALVAAYNQNNINPLVQPGVTVAADGPQIHITEVYGRALSYDGAGGAGAPTFSPSSGAPGTLSGGSVQSQVNLTAIPTSADSQVTLRNIYRIGGSQAQFQLVHTINDNVTTTWTDSTADNAITGQTLVPHRDPPAKFNVIVEYQDRVWGLGYTSTNAYTQEQVWYSLYQQPWAFDNTNQVLTCAVNPGNDPIIGGAALPNMMFVAKRASCWGISGTSQQDYVPIPLFQIGCIAAGTVKSGYGYVFWLSPEGIVYQFDGSSAPTDISTMTPSKCSIKGILDGYRLSDLAAASSFIYQDVYYIMFPTKGVTFGYYIPLQSWFSLGMAAKSVATDVNLTQPVAYSDDGTGAVVQWFGSGGTDLGTPMSYSWTSGLVNDSPDGVEVWTARHLMMTSQGGFPNTVNVQITAYSGSNQNSNNQSISTASTRQVLSLPPGLDGGAFQIQILGSCSTEVVINDLSLYAYPRRIIGTSKG